MQKRRRLGLFTIISLPRCWNFDCRWGRCTRTSFWKHDDQNVPCPQPSYKNVPSPTDVIHGANLHTNHVEIIFHELDRPYFDMRQRKYKLIVKNAASNRYKNLKFHRIQILWETVLHSSPASPENVAIIKCTVDSSRTSTKMQTQYFQWFSFANMTHSLRLHYNVYCSTKLRCLAWISERPIQTGSCATAWFVYKPTSRSPYVKRH